MTLLHANAHKHIELLKFTGGGMHLLPFNLFPAALKAETESQCS